MRNKIKIIDFSSAYAQLTLLVFLPIVVLAAVGAYLVEKESSKAIKSEQHTLATAALIRYEPMVKQLLPIILKNKEVEEAVLDTGAEPELEPTAQNDAAEQPALSKPPEQQQATPKNSAAQVTAMQVPEELKATDGVIDSQQLEQRLQSLDDVRSQISYLLSSMNNNQHIQRVAIIDQNGEVLAISGDQNTQPWLDFDQNQLAHQQQVDQQGFISGISTKMGTAYGHSLGDYEGMQYWLFIDMDNEPLTIAQLKVWLGLGVTSLFTLLMLLLSLNTYAKRWIAPIYNLRLYLQQITPENMYLPVKIRSSGELNQLQQDLLKTFRRLYADFQELKDHSDQTEDDLRDAFDEMEMQNIFIREARDQAISSSQAKSAFLANISHELRTPLNSIDGFINLLARHGDLTAEQDLYVQTIRKSSAHLLALVNDVLDFSKIEAGKLVLDKHEFSLYSAIYDVMDMLSPLAAEKGLRMAVMYYNDVPNTIIGDALRVKQVLTNLVGNAIKFTDVGEVVVRVGIDEVEEATVLEPESELEGATEVHANPVSGSMIHIAIQDTGQGISDKAKSQLFQSFSQGDPSITRQYGGTGLGLVISKQLTKLMGGSIGFYDNDNNNVDKQLILTDSNHQSTTNKGAVRTGATFWFSVPAHIELEVPEDIEFGAIHEDIEDDDPLQLPLLHPFAQSSTAEEKPFEMLVWINHTPTIQVFMAAMRPLNVNVTLARSLAGALEKLKEGENRWDWVIIDGGESETREDRAALLKQIRLHYQGKLAIYGYQVALDATLLERYKAMGLYQPFDKRQLYRMLDTRTNSVSTLVAPPTWQGVTVLAVDDHLPNLLVLDALLSELGIKVITANSGYDAVDIISKQIMYDTYGYSDMLTVEDQDKDQKQEEPKKAKIDLIFMDLQMPRMSGDEAAKKIRQLEQDAYKEHQNYTKRLPIIALTAHGLADGQDKLIAAGMDDYVGKPISRPQLMQILQRWLGRGGEVSTTVLKQNLNNTETDHSTEPQPDEMVSSDTDSDELPVVDWQDALMRSANKPDLAKQLLLMMQDSVEDELVDLKEAWGNRDREQLAQIAHRILGASRYSGVPQIRQASQNFEDKCLLNVQHTIPSQFNMLEEYYTALVTSLRVLQALDLETYITQQMQDSEDKNLSENDMTWKMI